MEAQLTYLAYHADAAIAPAAPIPRSLVRLRGFTRRFGEHTVIDGLDLDLAAGEFVALLGRSGGGKTTLLRTLAGLDDVAGQDVQVPSSRAVVFQDARLLPWKKVWRNVALGLKGRDVRQRAERRCARWGWGTGWMPGRSRFRAARRSAWRWPARWCANRNCCCWTSPLPRWTR
jgi:sulfonate transport system ATP-binding protein